MLPMLTDTPYIHLQTAGAAPVAKAPAEADESTPKSKPKHDKDQYIKKRMIIAGSSYCDEGALAKIRVGCYFDLVREPENPYDKNAVALMLEGQRIGYIARKDVAPFAACLNLRRPMYGVITDILTERGFAKYEYETWFDGNVK